MNPEIIPRPGELYRHFKGMLYQIITVAIHSETREELVIYQALYGEFKTYARPLTMFISEVDKEKYPDVTATYRFEKVERDALVTPERKEIENATKSEESQVAEKESQINEDLLAFLDASGYAEKLEILYSIRKRIDERLMTDIELSLDLYGQEGTLEERIDMVKNNLHTRARFETNRLR